MSSLLKHHQSPEEYLAIERRAKYKSEYVNGVVYALAGGSERHNLIVGNLVTELNIQLRKAPCRVYPSDLKVCAPNSKKFLYPDASIVYGEVRFIDDTRDVILNPILVVEVLSDSTVAFDRGEKFQSYQQIESLQEYLLVSQDEHVVEHYLRQENGHWLYTRVSGLEKIIDLPALKSQLPLSDIYNKAT